MNLDNIAERRWLWDVPGHSVSGLLSDGIIVRKVEGILIGDLPALVEVLRLRSSVKNPGDGKRYRTVTRPMVDGKEQDGVWYSVNVKHIDATHNPGRGLSPGGTIIQTLALWKGTLDQVWTRDTINPTFAAEGITETFSHIPHAAMDAYKTTLSTADSGYKVASIREKIYEDGYGDLIQTQEKVFAGTVTADNGTNTEAEYLPLLTGGVFRTTVWIGVKDADLATAMTTLATPPTGYFVRNLVNNYNGTGSCTIVRTMGPEGPYDVTPQANQFPSFDDERRTYWHAGLNATQAAAKYIELKTTCDAGYKVDSVELREYRWETVLVIQNISKLNLTLTGTVNNTDYTRTFGLVNIATTLYLNVAHDSIAGLKASILADATKLILVLRDDDVGQGKANLTCVWRSKEASPRSLGILRSTKPSQFHQQVQERVWIDVNLEDTDDLATAVAAALAGSGVYAVSAGDGIIAATGEDAGDKTGIIRQNITKKPGSYTYADYSLLDSFNPHGLREATMVTSVREYPEVSYSDLSGIYTALVTFLGVPIAKGRVQTSLNGNGTFAIRAFKEGTPDWDNTTPTYNKTNVRNPGVIGQQETFQATGVPVAQAPAIVAGAAASSSDYQLDNAQFVERGNGEAVIEATQTKKNETAVIVRNFPARGSQRAIDERIWPLVTQADFDTIWAAALTTGTTYPVPDATNILDYRQADLLGNGMWRVSSLIVKCPETTLISNARIAYSDDSYVDLTQVQDATNPPSASDTAGQACRIVALERNRYGKYDYVKQTTTFRVPASGSSGSWTTYGDYYWLSVFSGLTNTIIGAHEYQVAFTHTLTFHTTLSSAASAVTGGHLGSMPHKVGDNLWMAHKIVRSDIHITYVAF